MIYNSYFELQWSTGPVVPLFSSALNEIDILHSE